MLIGDELRQIATTKNQESAICIANKLFKIIIDEAYEIAKNGLFCFTLQRDKYTELYSSNVEEFIFNNLQELLKRNNITLTKEHLFRDDYIYKVEY